MLLTFRKTRLTEVGRFRARGVAVHQIGAAGEDQQRRQSGRQHIDLAHVVARQIEADELVRRRYACQPDSQVEFRCFIFVHFLEP